MAFAKMHRPSIYEINREIKTKFPLKNNGLNKNEQTIRFQNSYPGF